jgi:hypothetical protein
MAARFWVGGAGTWSSGNTANWSATSGGAGGASVPGSADTPTFDANSGTGVVTFTNGGVTVSTTTINNTGIELNLGAAFTTTGSITVTAGTFTSNNYTIAAGSLQSGGAAIRTISLGSSIVTLSSATGVVFTTATNLTLNAGTSSITLSAAGSTKLTGGGKTFYNVSFTSAALTAPTVSGANTFNNLTIAGRTAAGIAQIEFDADQTINGTLTLSAGTNATMRTFVRSNTIGTTRTLTCAAVASLQDIDFRDITIAGAAAPVSGTRLGDCKGNSGITFDAAKTVYWNLAGSNNWSATAWAATAGGAAALTNFPLAQDTAVFTSTSPGTGTTTTINAAYNIGTIDMSARTSNTMTLATGSTTPAIYGNWINGTGTTVTGISTIYFAGRGTQTITSAGKAFPMTVVIDSPGGLVKLSGAASFGSYPALVLTGGTFDDSGYNVTTTGTAASVGVNFNGTKARHLKFSGGAWVVATAGASAWLTTATNLTVTASGGGSISLTNALAKTFNGGGIQTYPTLNQGGTGTLTVTGSNKFAGLTNTAIGRIQFTGGTTNEFTSFTISGALGNLLQLGSTNTTQAILKKPTAWNVGANSTDAGNNTGLSFTAGSNDYLSVSYINGQIAAPASTIYYGATNITDIYYGSAAVSAVYYGSTKVF